MNSDLHLDLLNKLESRLIDYSSAFEQLKKIPKAWSTNEWKTKSKLLKKDFCEVCGNKDGILVLQHTKQPTEFKEIKENIAFEMMQNSKKELNKYFDEEFNVFIENKIKNDYKIRLGCPSCEIITIRERKTMQPRFICAKGHCFNEAKSVKYYPQIHTAGEEKAKVKFKEEFELIFFRKLLYEYIKEHDEEIGRRSLIIAIKESLEYYSLNHTKTACRKCAFVEDLEFINKKENPLFNYNKRIINIYEMVRLINNLKV